MGSFRKSETALLMVVVVVSLQLLAANGQPTCNFNPKPPCPSEPIGLLGHIVLVHGAGQGQWYWYKVKPILEAAGYKVTTVQLGPSVTMAVDSIENVTFTDYSKPLLDLMECIDHKVFLVGHSAGGYNIAVAMETYPKKIIAAVFVAAYMPDTSHPMTYAIEEGSKYQQDWLDTCIVTSGDNTWYFFGDDFLGSKLYQMCPPEDIALMHTQKRPGSFFTNEMAEIQLTEENYGSVDRFYIVARNDLAIPTKYQFEMVRRFPVKGMKVIKRSGHEVMLSKPLELSADIIHFTRKYSGAATTLAGRVDMKPKPNSILRGAWWV